MIKLIVMQLDGVLTSEQDKLNKRVYPDGWNSEEFDRNCYNAFASLFDNDNLFWIIAPSWRTSLGFKLIRKYLGNAGITTASCLDAIPKQLGTSLETDLTRYLEKINPSWRYSHLVYVGGYESREFVQEWLKKASVEVNPATGFTAENAQRVAEVLELKPLEKKPKKKVTGISFNTGDALGFNANTQAWAEMLRVVSVPVPNINPTVDPEVLPDWLEDQPPERLVEPPPPEVPPPDDYNDDYDYNDLDYLDYDEEDDDA